MERFGFDGVSAFDIVTTGKTVREEIAETDPEKAAALYVNFVILFSTFVVINIMEGTKVLIFLVHIFAYENFLFVEPFPATTHLPI